jgi:aspartyl-tRNA(Asn)/glutamyl-tRNA(Gln) amidotransferase subunit A
MMALHLWQLGARDIAARVRSGELSARAVAESSLARVAQVNPALNALIGVDAEWTLAQADSVDQRLKAGQDLPLAGVPVTVKDNLWVQGRRITQGSKLFADFIAPEDAWVVSRLRALGAVMVGITNCSEFACKGLTNNLLHGITRSPWDPRRTPGGSSGGAVAALAAGIGALALGTDAGGSTRRPAAHCGLVGMKPTFGVVPYGPGFEEPNFGLSVIGQLGRDVTDTALMFDSLRGWEHVDWGSQPGHAQRATDAIQRPPDRGLRIAFSMDLGCGFPIDKPVRDVIAQAIERLAADGYQIDEAAPQWPGSAREYPLLKLQHAGLSALYGQALAADPSRIDPDLAAQIRLGNTYTSQDIAELLLLRERIYAAYARFFQRYDLLLCPTTPVVSWPVEQLGPPEIGGEAVGARGHAAFTPLFNYCQAPACSVPVGLAQPPDSGASALPTGPSARLPVGLQIVGRRHDDALVFQMAAQFERLLGSSAHPPGWQ